MKQKDKIQLTLTFDSAEMKSAMVFFFKTYEAQLPLFLADRLKEVKIDADPQLSIGKDEIKFSMLNKSKGSVAIDKDGVVTFIDYTLVPIDTAYCLYENGQLVFFMKRGKNTADMRVGAFPDFNMLAVGLGKVEDPLVVLAKAEKMAAEAKEEVAAEAADVVPMEVNKDKE